MKKIIIALAICLSTAVTGQDLPAGYKLVYEQSFDGKAALEAFRFTQPAKWLLSAGKSGQALEFTGISDYQPPHRSPHTIGLIGDLVVGSFVLEADFLQTGREYGHRDMCVVFGFTDPARFYYTHIATKMDDNAHQVMIVNNAPRTKISTSTTDGVDWGENTWQRIRVERNAEEGSIRVFFNGVLIQEARDVTLKEGYIGFGSFDDSGKVDNVRIWAMATERKPATFFSSW